MQTDIQTKKDIKAIAAGVLRAEAKAVLEAIDKIDGQFEKCIHEIYSIPGRLVITGIGKSAIIGAKIVATLNSTGTPAVFMHAADAVHGDLGMIQEGDIVMCISKSGNTPEIKVLVPLLKRRGSKLIALVSNVKSYLAQQADYVIDGTVESEACPNGLAPTTSTTLHLALGDAMAVCLLQLRNFSSSDFAYFHPGGALGKQLYLTVSDIAKIDFPAVEKNSSLQDVIFEISSKRMGATLVLDNGSLAGIITDGDLRRAMHQHQQLAGLTAEQIMTANPRTISKTEFATSALKLMQESKITQLVVVEGDNPVGIIHLHDLLQEGIA
jgi:arabinose-5-phosphate isomerase